MSGQVIALPTAAPARVRQPEYHKRHRLARLGWRAGVVAILPPDHYRSPEARRRDAEAEERRALYREGGLDRGAPAMLIAALLLSMEPQRQALVLDRLAMLSGGLDEAGPRAALAYARMILDFPIEGDGCA